MDPAGREAQVRRFIEEVWNGQEYDAAADLYGASYTNAFGNGPSARSEAVRRYHQAFPDLKVDIDELVVAGDTVVLRTTFRGTDEGGVRGTAADRAGGRGMVGYHHAFRARQGRAGVGRCRQARSLHPARSS